MDNYACMYSTRVYKLVAAAWVKRDIPPKK